MAESSLMQGNASMLELTIFRVISGAVPLLIVWVRLLQTRFNITSSLAGQQVDSKATRTELSYATPLRSTIGTYYREQNKRVIRTLELSFLATRFV